MVLSKTASDLWISLASLFTDNQDYRAIQLEEQFISLKKGSLSIHDYCQCIKTTADNLADVGHHVSDKQLVLQTFHGLPKSYSTVVNLISFQNPLPTFFQTRSLLQMEETRISEPDPTPQNIIYTQSPHLYPNSPHQNSPNPYPNSPSQPQRGGYGHGRGYYQQTYMVLNSIISPILLGNPQFRQTCQHRRSLVPYRRSRRSTVMVRNSRRRLSSAVVIFAGPFSSRCASGSSPLAGASVQCYSPVSPATLVAMAFSCSHASARTLLA